MKPGVGLLLTSFRLGMIEFQISADWVCAGVEVDQRLCIEPFRATTRDVV
jgi:hypothetical protein